jgi:hypothetical protein
LDIIANPAFSVDPFLAQNNYHKDSFLDFVPLYFMYGCTYETSITDVTCQMDTGSWELIPQDYLHIDSLHEFS